MGVVGGGPFETRAAGERRGGAEAGDEGLRGWRGRLVRQLAGCYIRARMDKPAWTQQVTSKPSSLSSDLQMCRQLPLE